MTKRFIYLVVFIFYFFQTGIAQNDSHAEKILSDILSSTKTDVIRTDFKLSSFEKSNYQNHSTNGSITLKDMKFVIEMNEMKAWFNGKTQWAYIPQNNEVSITEPTEKELAETNPIAILSGFRSKSSIRFSKKKSNDNYFIEMTPNDKSLDISKIEIQVNKTTQFLFSIKTISKQGNISLLTFSNYQKGIKLPDSYFVFDASKHKGVIENDLR